MVNDKLEIKIKGKAFKNVILGLIGILSVTFGIMYLTANWWWIVAILIGAFVIYTAIDVLFVPKSIVLVADDKHLYVTFTKRKDIHLKQTEILNGYFFTEKYELAKLANIWRFKVKVNLSVAYEVIYAVYDSKKVTLLDITGDLILKKQDFETILKFIITKAPHIKIGK
jgi:hypothetical protein